MHIESLYIQGVRNIESLTLSPYEGLNQYIGPNGQGKTAILEALHLLIVGTSFRTHQLRELVRDGQKSFFVEATYDRNGVKGKLSLGYDGSRRYVSIQGELQPSSSMLFGNILGVTATPLDCDIIFGAPSERRRFIDEQIAQIDPQYIVAMKRLHRSLMQRNTLLKQKDFKTIEAWEEQIAKASVYIIHSRIKTVEKLAPLFQSFLSSLLGEDSARRCVIAYEPTLPYSSEMQKCDEEDMVLRIREMYREKREIEAKIGTTLYGPQRDDLLMTWNDGKSMKAQASLGQAKAIALSLRFAEWQLMNERSQEARPIFLIDDLQSFLDSERVLSTIDVAGALGQVFISSHEPCSRPSMIYRIHEGRVLSSESIGLDT